MQSTQNHAFDFAVAVLLHSLWLGPDKWSTGELLINLAEQDSFQAMTLGGFEVFQVDDHKVISL